ncbi:MAG TPA: PQQ-binding-like beta-propeller repeat protein [Vicinamibacteria bacterium]
MKRLGLVVFTLAVAAAGAVASSPGGDWPQWLGPTHDGLSPESGVFSGRPAIALKKAWRHEIDGGRSGLAVVGTSLYTLEADDEAEYALAIDARDGKERWRVKLDPLANAEGIGPASTPAVAAGRVFTLSTGCQLRALDAETGKVAWAVDLKAKFGNQLRLGCLNSPFVEGGRLVVQAAGKDDHRVVGLDAATGELVWSFKGAERVSYASPVPADLAGVRQLLVHHIRQGPPPTSGLTGLKLSDGTPLWSTTFEKEASWETPVALPDDRVLLVSWNDAKLVRLAGREGNLEAKPVWVAAGLKSRVSPPVYYKGHLYGFGGDDLVCMEAASGRVVWTEKTYPGSLILVDGHLVTVGTVSGIVRVVEATPSGYGEKARLEVMGRGPSCETPPSFAGGRIFVRNEEEIAAVEVGG